MIDAKRKRETWDDQIDFSSPHVCEINIYFLMFNSLFDFFVWFHELLKKYCNLNATFTLPIFYCIAHFIVGTFATSLALWII